MNKIKKADIGSQKLDIEALLAGEEMVMNKKLTDVICKLGSIFDLETGGSVKLFEPYTLQCVSREEEDFAIVTGECSEVVRTGRAYVSSLDDLNTLVLTLKEILPAGFCEKADRLEHIRIITKHLRYFLDRS